MSAVFPEPRGDRRKAKRVEDGRNDSLRWGNKAFSEHLPSKKSKRGLGGEKSSTSSKAFTTTF